MKIILLLKICYGIKVSKIQLSKINQSGRFLADLLGKFVVPLMKIAVPLTKNVLALLGTIALASAIYGAIQKKKKKKCVKEMLQEEDKESL